MNMKEKVLQEISRKVVGTIALRVVKKGKTTYFEKYEFPNGWNKISTTEVRNFPDRHIREWFNKQNKLISAERTKRERSKSFTAQSSK